jgi:type VI secretion system protein ImpB
MKRMTPGLNLRVENTLKGDGSEMAVQLKFNSLDDFSPGQIVQQVEALRKLLEARNKLRDLLTKVDRSEKLEGLLEEVLRNTEKMKQFSAGLGGDSAAGSQKGGA